MAETSYEPLNSSFAFATSYQTAGGILPEVSRTIERALKEGKMLDVVYGVKETVAALSQTPVNITVTGDSGNGMSSFINALRIIGHEEDASAPTGVFSLNHVNLAKVIQRMGKRFYIVWTKLDRDLSTCVLSEVRLLQNIRENIQENLQKEGVNIPPIFLVSNLDPLLHDFPKLRDMLHKDLSNIRCCVPLNTLSGTCEKIIDEKVAFLKERVGNGGSEHSVCIRDDDDMEECVKTYRLKFGIDDQSLQQVAQSMGTVVQEYKANLKSQNMHTLRRGDWRLRLMTCILVSVFFSILKYLPCLRCCVAWFRRKKHRRVLQLVAQDTKIILKKIGKDSISPPLT
ncbi:Immunity-related GTPase family M protein [Cricetulus griseus]|uniref:Immunity-related GTPase family M protein n=1 Tax=Cricetulus griseus TaxID=10029 RepID=G3HK05_CRIGR|nr:Immunity-related GTPase family M protein [Cricetulus griseus]